MLSFERLHNFMNKKGGLYEQRVRAVLTVGQLRDLCLRYETKSDDEKIDVPLEICQQKSDGREVKTFFVIDVGEEMQNETRS